MCYVHENKYSYENYLKNFWNNLQDYRTKSDFLLNSTYQHFKNFKKIKILIIFFKEEIFQKKWKILLLQFNILCNNKF